MGRSILRQVPCTIEAQSTQARLLTDLVENKPGAQDRYRNSVQKREDAWYHHALELAAARLRRR